MEKTLQWIVPVANNTARAHHGFGWVGEWANTGSGLSRKQPDVLRIETLYHADKAKADACILDLVVWLHCLVSYSRPNKAGRSPSQSPVRSPVQPPPRSPPASPPPAPSSSSTLTREDREMLRDACARRRQQQQQRSPAGKSKSRSQELSSSGGGRSGLSRNDRLSKSGSHSPSYPASRESGRVFPLTYSTGSGGSWSPVEEFDIDRIKQALDVMDRVDEQQL